MKTHINDTPMFKYLKLHFDATTALKLTITFYKATHNE